MYPIIQIPTSNLKSSIDFYTKLQFTLLSKVNSTIVSDGTIAIEINPDPYVRRGVQLFRSSWETLISSLSQYLKRW